MATDIVIKFEGGITIEGESQLADPFKNLLEATEYQEGAYSPRDAAGTGQVSGRTTVHGVTFKSLAGKHTNTLKRAMFENKPFTTVTIPILKQIGANLQAYDVRKFTNGYITNYDSKKGNDGPAHETWTLHATKVEWDYKPQDPATHELQGSILAEWDIAQST